ncbi:MAG: thiamine pyrophosphate-binding protein [Polyangiales bacterium]
MSHAPNITPAALRITARAAAPTTLRAAPRPAARHLVEALVAEGVETFFGVPGGPVSPIFEAVLATPGARLVASRHESAAAFAAMGHHRATGRVSAVLVTAGPGATNALTGVAAASTEAVPMLVISGDVPWASTGGRHVQDCGPEGLSIEAMFASVTRATVRVARAASAASQGLAALQAALTPYREGPALLVIPMDVAREPTDAAPLPRLSMRAASPAPADAVRETARLLASAARPLVVVGAGARRDAGRVRALLDALDVPFMTTPRAKGIVSEEHPRSLRNGGLAASWWARRYTSAGVDAALVLGTDLCDIDTGPTPPIAPDGTLVHVDMNPAVFNRSHRAALPVTADLGDFADALRALVVTSGVRNPRGPALAAEARARSPFDAPDFARDEAPQITPARAVADLERAAGPDARFVSDIGEHMLAALHYLTASTPERFTIHLGLGSMTSGIASAVGISLADRRRRVVCICGDGGVQMASMEALVAARERLPIVYAVFNDARYNMVHHGYKQLYGVEASWEMPPVDMVAWAASLGVRGARIDHPGEIDAALLDDLTRDGPCVLDIRIDREARIRGAGRNESLAHMSLPVVREEAAS